MNPAALLVAGLLTAIVIGGSRRLAALAVVASILFVPQGVKMDVAGINIFAFRLIALLGFLRVVARGELGRLTLTRIDKLVILFYVVLAVVYVLRSGDDIAYHVGVSIDSLIAFFFFRSVVGNLTEFRQLLVDTTYCLLILAVFVLLETFSRTNLLSSLGNASMNYGFWEREGRPRCFGAFRHPSLLGGVAACFLGSYLILLPSSVSRTQTVCAVLACLIIIWASNSGGPASSTAVAIIGTMLWVVRYKTYIIRRGLIAILLMAALLMSAPIWYLPARISGIAGGSGWHRSYLIDQAMKDIDRWWLVGMPISETASWFPYRLAATGGADITNQVLVYGLTAGAGSIVIFFIIIALAFRNVGQALRVIQSTASGSDDMTRVVWGLGVVVCVHLANWFGISYFDQSYAVWMLHIAVIAGIPISIGTQQTEMFNAISPYEIEPSEQ